MCNKKLLLKKLMEYPEITTNDYLDIVKRRNKTNNYNEIKLLENKINLYNEKQLLINMIKLTHIPFESN